MSNCNQLAHEIGLSFYDKKLNQALRTIYECGVKLEAKLETISSAAIYFHRFFSVSSPELFDPVLIGATCIYLAGKVEEDHIHLRDLINVFHSTLNRAHKMIPLKFDNYYWNLRESLVQLELLLLRVLKFDVNNQLAHQYLVHYLRSLTEWIGKDYTTTISLAQTCWSLLNDYYMDPKCINYSGQQIAIAVIQIALETHSIQIPYEKESLVGWKLALYEQGTLEKTNQIISDILTLYENDDKEYSTRALTSMENSSNVAKSNSEDLLAAFRKYTPSK
ncbi:cyclin-Q-like [Panonychus citri]|nr:cyclin-Q-like [Panonychus citri]